MITFGALIVSVVVLVLSTRELYKFFPTSCKIPVCQNSALCPGQTICEPEPFPILNQIDFAMVVIFTVEYILRLITSPFVPSSLLGWSLSPDPTLASEKRKPFTKNLFFHTQDFLQRAHSGEDKEFSSHSIVCFEPDLSSFPSLQTLALASLDPDKPEDVLTLIQSVFTKKKSGSASLDEPLVSYSMLNKHCPSIQPLLKLLCFFFSIQNLIDLGAILPYYLTLSSSNTQQQKFARLLRLFRVARVLKLMKSSSFAVVWRVILKSGPVINLLIIMILMTILFFGCVIYLLEGGQFMLTQDRPEGAYYRYDPITQAYEISPFNSINDGLYWATITITTIGYGDLSALSLPGRAVSCILAVLGIFVIALPVSVISTHFTDEYQDSKSLMQALASLKLQLMHSQDHPQPEPDPPQPTPINDHPTPPNPLPSGVMEAFERAFDALPLCLAPSSMSPMSSHLQTLEKEWRQQTKEGILSYLKENFSTPSPSHVSLSSISIDVDSSLSDLKPVSNDDIELTILETSNEDPNVVQ